MKTQPLKGMRDLLPREQALRDYIQGQILATYRAAGFQRISTPILEDMENLDKSEDVYKRQGRDTPRTAPACGPACH